MSGYRKIRKQSVDCPITGCEAKLKYESLGPHLTIIHIIYGRSKSDMLYNARKKLIRDNW